MPGKKTFAKWMAFFLLSVVLAAVITYLARPLFVKPAHASIALWQDVTDQTIGKTQAWGNKVELADINQDGRVDILFANGGDYETPGVPVQSRIFLNNDARKPFRDITDSVTGAARMLTRVIKVRDVNGDNLPDIFFGTTYQTQSQLYLGTGAGNFRNVTDSHLPAENLSVGDMEFGDVDSDGDLDMVLVDWGVGNPMHNKGGRVHLWLNDGKGHFSDATENMPDVLVRFSWDIALVDVDNNGELDILVSCKRCEHGFLFKNNGAGHFRDVSHARLPASSNNYAYEAMDMDGDNFLDLVSVNDGQFFQERILMNNRQGGFENATARLWPLNANPLFCDDNAAVFLDANSDGAADVLLASLNCADRLLLNDGAGHLGLKQPVFSAPDTRGTLGIALADLDGDHKLDVVQAQGEAAFDARVFLGSHILVDTAAPHITMLPAAGAVVRARVHDNKTPVTASDFRSVTLVYNQRGKDIELPMQWYGEYLWRAVLPAGVLHYQVCAMDAAGNRACVAQ